MTAQLAAYRTQASTAGLSTKQLITNLIKSKAEELGLVAATKILQAALVGLNIALALGASYLISKGISAWQEYSQRIETAATKSKEAADTAKQTTSSLKELVNTYEELGDKSEWDSDSYNQAKDIQEQILDVLKDQNSAIEDKLGKIDLANGKYQEQLGILKDITAEQLRNEHSDLKQDVVAQGDLLVKTAKKNTSQMAYVSGGANSSDGVMASKIANALGGTYNSASGSFSLGSMDLNDPKSIAEWYDKINQALKIFSENSTEAQMLIGGDLPNNGSSLDDYNIDKYIPVSLAGRVCVRVIGKVKTGDLIIPSKVPGIGRAVEDGEIVSPDIVVGYAVEGDDLFCERRIRVRVKG